MDRGCHGSNPTSEEDLKQELSCIFAKLLKKTVALNIEKKFNERSMLKRIIPGSVAGSRLKYDMHRLVQLVLHQQRSRAVTMDQA